MKKHLIFMATCAVCCISLSCADSDEMQNAASSGITPKTNWPLTTRQRGYTNGANALALNQVKEAIHANPGRSLALSPLSTTCALGMITYAAEGETLTSLTTSMGFPKDDAQAVCDFCASCIAGLPTVDASVTVALANAVYASETTPFAPAFQRAMRDYFGADAQSLDFHSASALATINSWCDTQTHGIIPMLLGRLDSSARSYLISTLCLMASWQQGFDPRRTAAHPFATDDGDSVQCQMMMQKATLPYYQSAAYQAVCIPMGEEGRFTMTILLPRDGRGCAEMAQGLTPQALADVSRQAEKRGVYLRLPRFETETELEQQDVLKRIGMADALSSDASYPGVYDADESFFVSRMFQKTRISVNENGIHAAAATVIEHTGIATGDGNGIASVPVTFTADHPFMYLITEEQTGLILFIGIYNG